MTEIRLTSEIGVDLAQAIGSDAMIAHAAMVSSIGGSCHPVGDVSPSKLEGLLRTLITKRHGTPFEHGCMTVRVHAPIKVWREWHRHRVGWSYNEESGRYKQLEPVFYLPPPDRPMRQADGFKAMAPTFDTVDQLEYDVVCGIMKRAYENSYREYEHLLSRGVDKGLARDVLGVGIYSACYCTANPRSIMHFLELRTERPDAKRPSRPLYEIRAAAEKLEALFAEQWPVTHRLGCENGRAAP